MVTAGQPSKPFKQTKSEKIQHYLGYVFWLSCKTPELDKAHIDTVVTTFLKATTVALREKHFKSKIPLKAINELLDIFYIAKKDDQDIAKIFD